MSAVYLLCISSNGVCIVDFCLEVLPLNMNKNKVIYFKLNAMHIT